MCWSIFFSLLAITKWFYGTCTEAGGSVWLQLEGPRQQGERPDGRGTSPWVPQEPSLCPQAWAGGAEGQPPAPQPEERARAGGREGEGG